MTETAQLPEPVKEVVKKRTKAPRVTDWPYGLRELPRKFSVMVEDFGFIPGSLARYAEQAARGDRKAQDRLEPLKQFFFELMSRDLEMRTVRHEDGARVGKPVMIPSGDYEEVNGRDEPVMTVQKEERSRWGIREGYDLVTHPSARKPFPGYIKTMVDEHFYSLCTILRFTELGAAVRLPDGRENPGKGIAEQVAESNTPKSGPIEVKKFETWTSEQKTELKKEFERVIKETGNPMRREVLRVMIPYILDNKKCAWDGRA